MFGSQGFFNEATKLNQNWYTHNTQVDLQVLQL